MIGGVSRHILPHLPGVPHLHKLAKLHSKIAVANLQVDTDDGGWSE